MSGNFELNTRSKVNAVGTGAKPDTTLQGLSLLLSPGRVIAVNGNGYDVGLIDEQGDLSRIYERVFCWPSATSLQVDAEVWVWLPDDGENPLILVAGGGSASCYKSVTDNGTLFG